MHLNNYNNNHIKLILIIISIALALSIVLSLRSCRRRPTKTSVPSFIVKNQPQSAEIILKQTDLYLFGKKNIKDCQIQADESKLFPSHNEIECTNVFCKLTTNKDTVATLQAEKAYINQQTKSMFLPGLVHGSFKNWSLDKQDVFYDAKKRTISAINTKLTSKTGVSIQAPQSTVDLDKEIILLENGVQSCFEK